MVHKCECKKCGRKVNVMIFAKSDDLFTCPFCNIKMECSTVNPQEDN